MPVMGGSRHAVCWCALGALRKIVGYEDEELFMEASRELHKSAQAIRGFNGFSIACYNDDPKTTHADMLAVFDDAIERNTKELS